MAPYEQIVCLLCVCVTSAAALSDFALPLVNVKSGWIFNFVASSVTVFDVAKEIHTQYIYIRTVMS